MPVPINFTDCPLDFVDLLFNQHHVEQGKSIEDTSSVIRAQFENEFNDAKNYFKIPSLNVKSRSNLRPNSLVRFRCMIQDMKDPEYYFPVIKIENKQKPGFLIRTGLFRDSIPILMEGETILNSDERSASDRHVFNCVPIPGECSWVKNHWFKLEENQLEPDKTTMDFTAIGTTSPSDCAEKRGTDAMSSSSVDDVEESLDAHDSNSKKLRSSDVTDNETASSRYAPFLESCCVKVYRNGDLFKLNDAVEFAGILTFDEQDENESIADDIPNAQVGSWKNVVSLHALFARKLTHLNPKLYNDTVVNEDLIKSNSLDVNDVREKFHKYLTVHLLGDELAAELLLCHLISFVTHKESMPLGKFALNLYNVSPGSFVSNVYDTLSRFVTKSVYLSLSLGILNNEKFVPKKDYEKNCLTTGRLQLANGTHVVVDETKLEAGQLIEQGIKNIAALQSIISNQKLDYDFHYHGVEFRTDYNVLILSEGLSCLPSDCALPMQISFTPANFSVEQTDKDLEKFRDYLTLVRFADLKIDEEMQKVHFMQAAYDKRHKIREDFVEMRRKNDQCTQAKLHELLVLARWVSFSYGSSSLKVEFWEKAKSLDEARRKRIMAK